MFAAMTFTLSTTKNGIIDSIKLQFITEVSRKPKEMQKLMYGVINATITIKIFTLRFVLRQQHRYNFFSEINFSHRKNELKKMCSYFELEL